MLWVHKSKFLLRILRIKRFLGAWHILLILLMNREKVKDFAYLFSIGTLNFKRFGDFEGTFKRQFVTDALTYWIYVKEWRPSKIYWVHYLLVELVKTSVLTTWWFGPYSRSHLLKLLSPAINVHWVYNYTQLYVYARLTCLSSDWTWCFWVIISKYVLYLLSTQNEAHQWIL